MSGDPVSTAEPPRGPSGNLFLIAARVPVAGQTKTRLGATIGMEPACRLYRAFLLDLARRFTPSAPPTPPNPGGEPSVSPQSWGAGGAEGAVDYDLGWAFTPADLDFRQVLCELGAPPQPASVRFVPQEGDGWGERQANLLRWGQEHGYERTVLIASDSPHLPARTPTAAFAALAEHDVALGRVHDGGYYLIGLRGFHDVFTAVPMSTASAADALAARAAALGLRLAELPPTFDIDEAADLDRLRAHLEPDGADAPATWAAVHDLELDR